MDRLNGRLDGWPWRVAVLQLGARQHYSIAARFLRLGCSIQLVTDFVWRVSPDALPWAGVRPGSPGSATGVHRFRKTRSRRCLRSSPSEPSRWPGPVAVGKDTTTLPERAGSFPRWPGKSRHRGRPGLDVYVGRKRSNRGRAETRAGLRPGRHRPWASRRGDRGQREGGELAEGKEERAGSGRILRARSGGMARGGHSRGQL